MSDEWVDSADHPSGISKVTATPTTEDGRSLSRREIFCWDVVGRYLGDVLKTTDHLAKEYAHAKVAQESNTARKIAEEASELAARAEEALARAEISKQKATAGFIKNLDRIAQLPAEAQAIALAKLATDVPRLTEQLDRVRELVTLLELTKGVAIMTVPKESHAAIEKNS